MSDPLEIYQRHIDLMSEALMRRDTAAVLSLVAYPLVMKTLDAELTVTTDAEMEAAAIGYWTGLANAGAQSLVRIAHFAFFDGAAQDRIIGEHRSYLMKGSTMMVEPFDNQMVLVERDGTWRVHELRACISNKDFPILSPAQLLARKTDAAAPSEKGTET